MDKNNPIRKICVFDTETTDCMPRYPKGMTWPNKEQSEKEKILYGLEYHPHVLQLSYVIYDLENPDASKIYNKYIKITPEIGAKIHPEAAAKCRFDFNSLSNKPESEQTTITEALTEFVNDVRDCQVIVGHNVSFDRKIMLTEVLRLPNADKEYLKLFSNDENFTCSMRETSLTCNLRTEVVNKSGKITYRLKAPKLSEAYNHYFGYFPSGDMLHDAVIDIVVCLRLFMKYKFNRDICGENSEITRYIKLISPPNYNCSKEDDVLPPMDSGILESELTNPEPASNISAPIAEDKYLKTEEHMQLGVPPSNEVAVEDSTLRRSSRKRTKTSLGGKTKRQRRRKYR